MKHQIQNSKSQINHKLQTSNTKQYDLEDRTLIFSKSIISLCRNVDKNLINRKLIDQLIRSATSIGANYREANETDTKRDFKHRIRIAKKEAKETIYWLKLLKEANKHMKREIVPLLGESQELMKILAAIYEKTK